MPDILVPPLADQLLSCLCTQLSSRPNPPANCCLRVGSQVNHDADLFVDLCCEGLAYVSVGDSWPTSQAPDLDVTNQAQDNCRIPSWAVEFRAGVVRCIPVGGENGEMPTCQEWTDAAIQGFYDASALRAAACCFKAAANALPAMDGMSVVIGRQSTVDPLGGCIERNITVTVQIPNCDC